MKYATEVKTIPDSIDMGWTTADPKNASVWKGPNVWAGWDQNQKDFHSAVIVGEHVPDSLHPVVPHVTVPDVHVVDTHMPTHPVVTGWVDPIVVDTTLNDGMAETIHSDHGVKPFGHA